MYNFKEQEKWKIASNKSGSGNTTNIGSITYIADILQGRGIFAKLGEEWFNEYWQNYGKITFKVKNDDWIEQNIVVKKTIGNTK